MTVIGLRRLWSGENVAIGLRRLLNRGTTVVGLRRLWSGENVAVRLRRRRFDGTTIVGLRRSRSDGITVVLIQ